MKIYVDYVLKNLAAPTIFITASLVCVVWLTQSLRFIDLIINQGLPVYDFMGLIILLIPSLFGLVLPIAILCATIYTYNKLNHESEILVLKAAGISRLGIAKPAIILAFLVMIFGYAISFYFLPVSYRKFRDMQYYFRDNYASLMLEEGIFNNPLKGLMVYVSKREDANTLSGILVHDNRIPEKPVTMLAETARVERGPNGLRFVMNSASRQQVDRKTGEVSMLYFDSYPFDIGFYADTDNTRNRKADELYINELLHPSANLTKKQRNKQMAEAHDRINWPLNNFSLPLIVLAVMLSGDFNRRGQSRRIMLCVAIAIGFIIANMALKNIAADGNKAILYGMYLPNVLAITISFYVLAIGKNPFEKKVTPANEIENKMELG